MWFECKPVLYLVSNSTVCSAPQSFGLINAPSPGTAQVHAEPGWPPAAGPAAAPECSDSSWWLCRGPQTGGWPCPPSPLCVQLWCCNEIDAFPQIIFPWKQSWWLLWRRYWWIGGSHLGDCFRNTCPIHEHKAKFTTWNNVKCCPLGPYSWCAELNPESG